MPHIAYFYVTPIKYKQRFRVKPATLIYCLRVKQNDRLFFRDTIISKFDTFYKNRKD